MKKIYKKLVTIGTIALPTATVLSCAEVDNLNPGAQDPAQNKDSTTVTEIINVIRGLPRDVGSTEGRYVLPSQVTESNLKKYLNDVNLKFSFTPDEETTIEIKIGEANDQLGELNVTFIVNRGQVTDQIEIKLTGFLLKDSEFILEQINGIIQHIRSLGNEASLDGKETLPSSIRDAEMLKSNLKDGNYPDPANFPPVKALTFTPLLPFEANDDNGELTVTYQISKASVEKSETITYVGFLTKIDQSDKTAVNTNVSYVKALRSTFPDSNFFSSDITTEAKLKEVMTPFPEPKNGVTINATKFNADNLTGQLDVTYTISKGARSADVLRHYSGFKQTTAQVKTSMKVTGFDFQESTAKWSQEIKADPEEIKADPQEINAGHYLIGTENGVYQIETDPKDGNKIIKSVQVPMEGPNSIPDVSDGFIERISERSYLIGTNSNGLYGVEVNPETGMITKADRVNLGTPNAIPKKLAFGSLIPVVELKEYILVTPNNGLFWLYIEHGEPGSFDGAPGSYYVRAASSNALVIPETTPGQFEGGWAQQIDDTHYWIAADNGIYQVEIDNSSETKNKTTVLYSYGSAILPSSNETPHFSKWTQKIDETHYLIMTGNGLYQVEIDPNTKTIKEGSEKAVSEFALTPGAADFNTSWIQRIAPNHYLVGVDNLGVHQIVINPETGLISDIISIPSIGDVAIPKTVTQFAQKLGDTDSYWIPTDSSDKGAMYKITVDLFKQN